MREAHPGNEPPRSKHFLRHEQACLDCLENQENHSHRRSARGTENHLTVEDAIWTAPHVHGKDDPTCRDSKDELVAQGRSVTRHCVMYYLGDPIELGNYHQGYCRFGRIDDEQDQDADHGQVHATLDPCAFNVSCVVRVKRVDLIRVDLAPGEDYDPHFEEGK